MAGPWEKYANKTAAGPWEKYAEQTPPTETDKGALQAALFKGNEGVLFGGGPIVAGVGGAIGEALGTLKTGRKIPLTQKISEAIASIPEGYETGRKDYLAESKRISEQYPKTALGSEIAGGLLTAPLTPIKTIGGAAKLGAGVGFLRGVGEGDSVGEIASKTLSGAGLGAVTMGASKVIGKGVESAPGQKLISGIKGQIGKATGKLGAGAARIGEALTGVPKQEIKTYAKNVEEVNRIIQKFGNDIPAAADAARERLSGNIQSYRQKLSSGVGESLNSLSPDKTVPAENILKRFSEMKSQLNPKLYSEVISELDDVAAKISDVAGDTGALSLKEVHEVKEFLQGLAKGSYLKSGQIFSVPDKVARAAKYAAADARKIVNAASPEIATANNSLAELHSLEKMLNKNILAPGKPEAAFMAAGSGVNKRNEALLKRLGEITGTDILGESQKLAAARTFASPELLPKDVTGKAAARMAAGAGVGTLTGVGPIVGGLATSPFALKQAINIGNVPVQMGKKILSGANISPGLLEAGLIKQASGRGEENPLGYYETGSPITTSSLLDQVTGSAATRSAMQNALRGRFLESVPEDLSKLTGDPSTAPRGEDIAKEMGFEGVSAVALGMIADGLLSPSAGMGLIKVPASMAKKMSGKSGAEIIDLMSQAIKQRRIAIAERNADEMKIRKIYGEEGDVLKFPSKKEIKKMRAPSVMEENAANGFKNPQIIDEIMPTLTDEKQQILNNLVARYGDHFPEEAFAKAQKSDLPYAPISEIGVGKTPMPMPNFSITTAKQLGRKQFPGEYGADPLEWMDQKYGITKDIMLRNKSIDLPMVINTASDLIGHADYIAAIPKGSTVNLILGFNGKSGDYSSETSRAFRLLYPSKPSEKRIISAYKRLQDAGINVNLVTRSTEELKKDITAKTKALGFTKSKQIDDLVKQLAPDELEIKRLIKEAASDE